MASLELDLVVDDGCVCALSDEELEQTVELVLREEGVQRPCCVSLSVVSDERMRELAKQYPQYGWEHNMGYPTPEHIAAIKAHGYCPEHRKSFHPKELEPTLFDQI